MAKLATPKTIVEKAPVQQRRKPLDPAIAPIVTKRIGKDWSRMTVEAENEHFVTQVLIK